MGLFSWLGLGSVMFTFILLLLIVQKMGLFIWLGLGRRKSDGSDGSDDKKYAKDGTIFQPTKDGKHVVITHKGGGKPSVGHNKDKGKK